MSYALVEEVQVLLEGVPLPATKDELCAYARHQEAEARLLNAICGLPDRVFRSLDEVGEELAHVQPTRPEPDVREPNEESSAPPGGDDYARARSR